MTRIISVITAVHGPSAHFLADAYRSLCEQELPDGWAWQWVIQEDGTTDAVSEFVPDDPRISFAQGRRGGAAVARTLGLSRAAGEFIKVLDSDDILPPGTLARDLAILLENPDIGWTTSSALDLLPDGSTVAFDDPPGGPIEQGSILPQWKARNYIPPVIPGSLCMRRELIFALGGWMALPASEDTGLLLALNAVSRGWFIREAGLLYRKWPGQSTGQAAHSDGEEREARASVAETRALALAELTQWRFTGAASKVSG
ncbi:glycosyltransferase family 2 protein [Streptomyces mayteni]